MAEIMFFSAIYIVCGFLFLIGVWGLFEGEISFFHKLHRSIRIVLRLGIMLLWPIPCLILILVWLYLFFQYVWETITK